MHEPTATRTQRLARRLFPTREARRRRSLQLAVFFAGLVGIILGFELMRINVADSAYFEIWPSGTAPFGFLLLFIGVGASLISFGYLVSPLHPWQTAPDDWGDIATLPAGGTVDRRDVAHTARLLFILILVAGLLLLEGILLYNMATATHLFVRDNCVANCGDMTRPELAFVFDLITIGAADGFVVAMLFVYIQP